MIGANREEAFSRGGTPPDLRAGPVKFVAGLDPKAASNDGAQHASDATPEPPSTGEGAP